MNYPRLKSALITLRNKLELEQSTEDMLDTLEIVRVVQEDVELFEIVSGIGQHNTKKGKGL